MTLLRRTLLIAVLLVAAPATGHPAAQKADHTDLAAKMTGTWKLNKELSTALPGPGRRGRRGGALFAAAAPQRGGRIGGGETEAPRERPFVTEAEAAAQAAIIDIQQIPADLSIEATAETFKLIEPRGDAFFRIDGKNTSVEVPGSSVKVRTRWDRAGLRQEFSSAMLKLTRTWSVNADNRLVITQRLESVSIKPADVQAVFDRQ